MNKANRKEKLLRIADELFKLSDSLIAKYNQTKPHANFAQVLMMFFISKSRQSAKSFMLLVNNGLKNDAQGILRTILENLINMEFIFSKDAPEFWAERYIEFQIVSSLKYAKKYLKHGQNKVGREKVKTKKQELEATLTKLRQKYGQDFGKSPYWSGMRIKDMAYACNLHFYYDILYSLWSDFAHANIESSRDYSAEINGELKIIEQLNHDYESELAALVDFFIRINDRFNNEFSLGMELSLNKIKEHYIEIGELLKHE